MNPEAPGSYKIIYSWSEAGDLGPRLKIHGRSPIWCNVVEPF